MLFRGSEAQQQFNCPADGDIVIFQPEFIEFGGEERLILSLSRELHAQGKAHSILCYRDHINLAAYATWSLKLYQFCTPKNHVSKVISLRRCLKFIYQVGAPHQFYSISNKCVRLLSTAYALFAF